MAKPSLAAAPDFAPKTTPGPEFELLEYVLRNDGRGRVDIIKLSRRMSLAEGEVVSRGQELHLARLRAASLRDKHRMAYEKLLVKPL